MLFKEGNRKTGMTMLGGGVMLVAIAALGFMGKLTGEPLVSALYIPAGILIAGITGNAVAHIGDGLGRGK